MPADAAALMAKWKRLRELRAPVRKQIEELRTQDKVGSSLQAEVELRAEARTTSRWRASATTSSSC